MKYNNLVQALQEASQKKDLGVYFTKSMDADTFVTYNDIYKKAVLILYLLQEKGIKAGDELVIHLQDNQHFLHIFWACVLGGIVPVPVAVGNNDEHRLKLFKIWQVLKNPNLITEEKSMFYLEEYSNINKLDYIYKDILNQTTHIEEIFNDNIDMFKEGKVHTHKKEDIAFIQFSSGSTGDPKGVVLTHENLVINIMALIKVTKTSNEDAYISWMPLTHDMGLIGGHLLPILAQINQCIIPTKLFIRVPSVWMKKAIEHKCSMLLSPNFGLSFLLNRFNETIAKDWDLSHIKSIINGAEPISSELCNKFLDKMEKYNLRRSSMLTVYGMAEASVGVSIPNPEDEFVTLYVDRRYLSIGEKVVEVEADDINALSFVEEGPPIEYCYLRVCDEMDNILEDGYIGELQISGGNVTKGYYRNPQATEKAKTKDGWLRTGDLGFFRNGSIVVTGRLKDIIFVNGQNLYPHDVERVLEDFEEIELGKVVASSAYDKDSQSEQIVIYVLFKKSIEKFLPLAEKIEKFLRLKMGLFVKSVVPVRKIFKTTSGKVQRYKFSKMYEEGNYDEVINAIREGRKEIAATLDISNDNIQIENKIVDICKEILKIDNIEVNDNIYEYGVNSLKLSNLASRIHESFSVEIPLTELFKYSTVRELANYVDKCQEKNIYSGIEPLASNDGYPEGCYEASAAQKRLHVLDQIDLDTIGPNIGYNMPEALLIEGDLDVDKFNQAFKSLVMRHESLRTSFVTIDGEPVQKIHNEVPFKVVYQEAEEDKVNDIMKCFVQPFDLQKPSLLRAGLIKIKETKYVLIIDMHHIISDGWSMLVLLKELIMLMEHKELPPIKVHYKDFAVWQNEVFKSDIMKEKEEYWLGRFGEGKNGKIPVLTIPTDYTRPSQKNYQGDRVLLTTSSKVLEELSIVEYKTTATLHMIMLGAYNVLLSKYSGQDDIIVGSPIAGRSHKDLQNIFGMFVNMLVNRNKVSSDMTFREFLTEVKTNCLNTYQNQEYQFDQLVGKLKLKRDMSRNPLFDYVFAVQNLDIPEMENSKIKMSLYDYEYNISRFDMFLSVMKMGESVRFMLEYSTSLFKRTTAERFLKHYMEILDQIKDNIDIKISDITLSHNLTQAKSNLLEEDDEGFGF